MQCGNRHLRALRSAIGTDLNIAGIARGGSSGSYEYSVINSPNHPISSGDLGQCGTIRQLAAQWPTIGRWY